MRSFVRIVFVVIAVTALAVAGALFGLPSRATAEREIEIARPAASVFARLASMPAGAPLSPGVSQTVATAENNVVTASLAFPDGAEGRAVYTVRPNGAGAAVTIRIESPLGMNPIARVQGLSGAPAQPYLEAAATAVAADLNALPAESFQNLVYEVVQVEPRPFFFNQNCSPQDAPAIREAVAASLIGLRPVMQRYNLTIAGEPVAVETSWTNNQYCFQVGFPFTGAPPRVLGLGQVGQTPSGSAIRVRFTGPEENVLPTYAQMEALIAAARLEQGRSFEIYFDDPTQAGGAAQREIYYIVTGDLSRLAAVAPSAAAPASAPSAPAAAASAPAATPAPAAGQAEVMPPPSDGPAEGAVMAAPAAQTAPTAPSAPPPAQTPAPVSP